MDKSYRTAMDAIMAAGRRGVVFDQMPGAYGPGMDAGAASGMAFLVGELEKQDPRLLEPLTSLTGPRDIDMKPGGGWVSIVSNVFVDYATTGNQEDAIIGSETTNIPVSQANISKDVFKVFTFSEILRVPLFDDLKLQQIGRSLTQMLDDGLRLNHGKILDRNIYNGITKAGTYGLVNNPNITSGYVAYNAAGTSRTWANKTPLEIMTDINTVINATWAASEYDLTGMATHILIPPSQFAYLVAPVTIAGANSIMEYVLRNNVATLQGKTITINPSRWCIGAGTAGTDRLVAYVKAENRVNMDMTVPLSRVMTAPVVQSASYETLYASQFSEVKFLYTQCAEYADGI
jgi:Uncharacterized protein conserved in bacteria (DUF2184)